MISEAELAKLSHSDAPKILTKVPGPRTIDAMKKSSDFESFARGGGGAPVVFEEGKGATVKDPDGNIYIDITAGVAVNNVGRCHPRVIEAIQGQMCKLMHAIDITNTRRIDMAEAVSNVMPEGLRGNCVTYFTQGGSGAVETAIKWARKITGKTGILAFHGAYHGVWCGSGSLTTGDQYRAGFAPSILGVIHAPYPYSYRCCFNSKDQKSCEDTCANYIDYLLNTPYTAADNVAALIIEAEQGEGGYVAPSPEFFQKVKRACERAGVLYISDEVQAGAGRTGKMWAIEHTGVVPDMLTWGKGMGGDMPNGGLTIRKDLAANIDDSSQPNTFAGNALTAATTLANIEILKENDFALVKRAAALGEEIKGWLREGQKDSRLIGDVRGRGLMIGIELVQDKETKTPLDRETMVSIIMGFLARGVIMVPCGRYGNVFRFMPPLVITREHAKRATDILLEVLKEHETATSFKR